MREDSSGAFRERENITYRWGRNHYIPNSGEL